MRVFRERPVWNHPLAFEFRRTRTALRLVAVIALGVAVRKLPGPLPPGVRKVGGDVLWATMFFLLARLAFPRAATAKLAMTAFVVASLTEFNKRLHLPALDALRATTLGGFLLGRVFQWGNFLSYAVGAALGFGWEALAPRPCRLIAPTTPTSPRPVKMPAP